MKRNHRPQNVATKASFKPQETEFSFFSSSFLTPQAYTKSFFFSFFSMVLAALQSRRESQDLSAMAKLTPHQDEVHGHRQYQTVHEYQNLTNVRNGNRINLRNSHLPRE